jgi:DNA-binding transcriptional LysR family regulator
MANIELRLYRYFVTLCEEKHFARAAERLNISPSTLTHQIQKLEKELDARLLSRKTKMAVQLTETGARFCEVARDVLHHATEAELNVRKAARGEIGSIDIGYLVSASSCGFLPKVMSNFQKEKPGLELNLRIGNSAALIDALAKRELDVAFITPPRQYPPELTGYTVFRQPLALAVPRQHWASRGKGPVNPAALKDELFVVATIESDLGFVRLTDAVAELGKFVPKVSRRALGMSSILTHVAMGNGIAVVPKAMSAFNMPNVIYRDFEGFNKKTFPLVFVHRSSEASPATRAFIEFMARHKLKGEQSKETVG